MELIEYNHVAGHHCRIRNCKEVPYHNDLKDHHSHRICLECNTRIQKEEEKSIKYYKKEEELKQKRKLKEYQAQDLARILTEKYLEKTKTYLYKNRSTTNEKIERKREAFLVEWKGLKTPEDQKGYIYHCEREYCLRPLKKTHYTQILDMITCKPCEKIITSQIYTEYRNRMRKITNQDY